MPKLKESHKLERVEFAETHSTMDWSQVVFSDECVVSSAPGKKASGCESIAVWASLTVDGPQDIVKVVGKLTAQQYIYQILSPNVTPFFNKPANADMIFQHDNSPVHTALHVQTYLRENNIRSLKWPSCSPDLNPIEEYWELLKCELGEIQLPVGSADVKQAFLWNLVKLKWNDLKEGKGPDIISNYYKHMHQRIAAVAVAKGETPTY